MFDVIEAPDSFGANPQVYPPNETQRHVLEILFVVSLVCAPAQMRKLLGSLGWTTMRAFNETRTYVSSYPRITDSRLQRAIEGDCSQYEYLRVQITGHRAIFLAERKLEWLEARRIELFQMYGRKKKVKPGRDSLSGWRRKNPCPNLRSVQKHFWTWVCGGLYRDYNFSVHKDVLPILLLSESSKKIRV